MNSIEVGQVVAESVWNSAQDPWEARKEDGIELSNSYDRENDACGHKLRFWILTCSCSRGPGAGPGVKGTRPYKRDISFNGVKRPSMPARLNMRSAGK